MRRGKAEPRLALDGAAFQAVCWLSAQLGTPGGYDHTPEAPSILWHTGKTLIEAPKGSEIEASEGAEIGDLLECVILYLRPNEAGDLDIARIAVLAEEDDACAVLGACVLHGWPFQTLEQWFAERRATEQKEPE